MCHNAPRNRETITFKEKPRCIVSKLWQKYKSEKLASNIVDVDK